MQGIQNIFAITAISSALVGCTCSPTETAELANPPFYVPTTAMLQPSDAPPEPVSALAWQVLPAADDDLFFVGRGEKAVYTALPLTEMSAFSIFTYDAQRIASPRDSGYRYTWQVREGVWAR